MGQIDNIVDVQITRQTRQIDITSFDIPLILVEMTAEEAGVFGDRVKTYTSLDALGSDLPPTHKGYIIAQKLLGGDTRPSTFKVGMKLVGESYVEAVNAVTEFDDTWYVLIMDSHEDDDINSVADRIQAERKLFFTSTSTPKAFEQSQSVVYTATVQFDIDGIDTGDMVSVRIAGENYSSLYDGTDFGPFTGPAGGGSFDGSFTINDATGLLTITHGDRPFTVTRATQEVDNGYTGDVPQENISVTDPVGMDIGQRLKFKGMFRTIVMYSSTADSEWPEAAWVGGQITAIPGSNAWEYKSLPGVTVDHTLTDSQIQILQDRNYNYYIPVKGVNITRRGVSADNEWVD